MSRVHLQEVPDLTMSWYSARSGCRKPSLMLLRLLVSGVTDQGCAASVCGVPNLRPNPISDTATLKGDNLDPQPLRQHISEPTDNEPELSMVSAERQANSLYSPRPTSTDTVFGSWAIQLNVNQ